MRELCSRNAGYRTEYHPSDDKHHDVQCLRQIFGHLPWRGHGVKQERVSTEAQREEADKGPFICLLRLMHRREPL